MLVLNLERQTIKHYLIHARNNMYKPTYTCLQNSKNMRNIFSYKHTWYVGDLTFTFGSGRGGMPEVCRGGGGYLLANGLVITPIIDRKSGG